MRDQPCAQSLPHDSVARWQALARHTLRGSVQNLRLTQTEDGLILQGQVHTYYAKQCAQHTVMTLTAMPIAANQIDVVEPAPLIHDGQQTLSDRHVLT